jgi:hypothetical protein
VNHTSRTVFLDCGRQENWNCCQQDETLVFSDKFKKAKVALEANWGIKPTAKTGIDLAGPLHLVQHRHRPPIDLTAALPGREAKHGRVGAC